MHVVSRCPRWTGPCGRRSLLDALQTWRARASLPNAAESSPPSLAGQSSETVRDFAWVFGRPCIDMAQTEPASTVLFVEGARPTPAESEGQTSAAPFANDFRSTAFRSGSNDCRIAV